MMNTRSGVCRHAPEYVDAVCWQSLKSQHEHINKTLKIGQVFKCCRLFYLYYCNNSGGNNIHVRLWLRKPYNEQCTLLERFVHETKGARLKTDQMTLKIMWPTARSTVWCMMKCLPSFPCALLSGSAVSLEIPQAGQLHSSKGKIKVYSNSVQQNLL